MPEKVFTALNTVPTTIPRFENITKSRKKPSLLKAKKKKEAYCESLNKSDVTESHI